MTTVVNPQLESFLQGLLDMFNTDIDAGLMAIGTAITNCCTMKYMTTTFVVTPAVPAGPNGMPPAQPAVTADVPTWQLPYLLAQNNASGAWQTQQAAWIAAYEQWQTQQAAVGLLQLGAQVTAIVKLMTQLEEYQKCANEEQDDMKVFSDHLRATATTACSAYAAHADMIMPVQADLSSIGMWEADFEAANIDYGYDQIQKDHVQNMGTHLAQLCTNARDVNNNLTTCLNYLDGTWTAGGDWAAYEDCLLIPGVGEFTDTLKDSAASQNAISDYLQTCGQTVADCFTTGGDSWLAAIKPALNDLIGCMTQAQGVLDDSKALSADAVACMTALKDNWTQVYDPEESAGGTVDSLFDNANCLFTQGGGTNYDGATFMKDCTAFLSDCAIEKKEIFERYLGTLSPDASSGEYCLGRVIIDQACGLVNNLQQAVTFLGTHKDDCIDIYNTAYNAKEETLNIALMNEACNLAVCLTNMHNWLDTHGDQMDACWTAGYDGEKAHAAALLAEAELLVDTHSDTFDFLCQCADEFKACYRQYALKEHVLNTAVMQEACDMAPCVQDVHNWLCEQAEKQHERYCQFWVEKENSYACDLIDKALELACDSYNCLDDWCDDIEELFECIWDCYKDPECITAAKLIDAGVPSCEKNEILYGIICDRSEDLWDKFWGEWCPCDTEDLNRHCEMHDKQEMLCEIADNANCVQSLGEVLKECYENEVLTCEKEYLRCVCDMPKYDPKYCEMESRAILHVRKQYDMQAEEIERCISPYCTGALIERIVDLRDEQVKTEQLSIQIADRWEWLRKVHEDDRRHRYHMDTLQFLHTYVADSAALYEQSTRANDIILQRIHERIVRGYTYLNSSLDHANSTFNAVQNASANALRGIDLGHFWPNWHTNSKQTYLAQSDSRLNVVQNMLTHGLNVDRHATDAKTTAANLAIEQQRLGQNAIAQGHDVGRMAIDAKVQADMVASRVSQQGLQAAQNGHFYHRQASADKNSAVQTAQIAGQFGQRAIEHGHNHKQMALDAATSEWQGAHAGVQDGIAAIDRGHWWLEQARADKAQAYDQYMSAWRMHLDQLNHGRNNLQTAQSWCQHAGQLLNSQMGQGFDAIQAAIAIWSEANNKVESSLNAQSGNIGRAIEFYNSGLQRQQLLLNGKTQMSGFITDSTNAMAQQAQLGHNLQTQACNASYRTAQLEKDCYEYACTALRDYGTSFGALSAQVGGAIIGSSNNQAQNTMGMLAGLGNSLFSNLSTIVGPPPSQPPGFPTVPAPSLGGGF